MSTVIKVENLSKKYMITHEDKERYVTLRDIMTNLAKNIKSRILHPFTKGNPSPYIEEFWALKDVSFEVKQGERVGIIGSNGAGKSTLLKLLSRITEPTDGRMRIKGRVSSLLEVGTGFHPELTGRENIYLNGAILGMSRAEINKKYHDIVAFAEVEKFIDTPVKRYSSGMQVRLAFAVAAHLEPNILIVDEVLAVGDAQFQKKCLGKMDEVAGEGRTVLFVSHNMGAIKQLCNRGIMLSNGEIVYEGGIDETVNRYIKTTFYEADTSYTYEEDNSLRIQFLQVELLKGETDLNEEITYFVCKYKVREVAENIVLSVNVNNNLGVMVYYSNDLFLDDTRKRQIGYHKIKLSIPTNLLSPGDYYTQFAFWEPGKVEHFPQDRLYLRIDERKNPIPGLMLAWPSILYLPERWSYL